MRWYDKLRTSCGQSIGRQTFGSSLLASSNVLALLVVQWIGIRMAEDWLGVVVF